MSSIDFLSIHPDFGKGGAGLSEALGGATLRDLMVNHQAVSTEIRADAADLRTTVQQIVIDGVKVRAATDYFVAIEGQTIFPLSAEPLGDVEVRVNGAAQILGLDFEVIGVLGARSIHWLSQDFLMDDGDVVVAAYIRYVT